MKEKLLILIVFLTVSLFSEMSEPVYFWDNYCMMTQQNSLIEDDGIIYLVFRDIETDDIVFGKSNELGSFTFLTISNTLGSNVLPTITKTDTGEIFVSFICSAGNSWINVIAKSGNDGESFALTYLEECQILHPIISYTDGSLKLIGITGSPSQACVYEIYLDNSFTENVNEEGFQGDYLYFGIDVFRGNVHHNDDIWVGNFGGGDNNGWPTFYGHVSTTGRLRSYPGGSLLVESGPIDDIFLGGYSEEVPTIILPSTLDLLEQNGTQLGLNADILFIVLAGNNYSGYEGVLAPHVEEFPVYSWYPATAGQAQAAINDGVNWFEESDIIHTNFVTVYDTIWTPVSGTIPDGSSYYTEAELWIKGEVSGKQVWGSTSKVRILGDITYTNTVPGECPDGFSGYDNGETQFEGDINETDYFGLLSEGRINIGYKYRDPESGEVVAVTNVVEDDLYLYGAYAAIGIGDENEYGDQSHHYDGMFTFEYQHPHGSTPNFIGVSPYTGSDTLYSYIDYHKFIVPADALVSPHIHGFNIHASLSDNNTSGYPALSELYVNSHPNVVLPYKLPLGADFPNYNPVWPESFNDIVFERGTLKIFGAKIQRTSGYLHRSGQDSVNHLSDSDDWDLEENQYACSHPSTGYDREYNYDHRFVNIELPNFPILANDLNSPELKIFEYNEIDESFVETNSLELELASGNINTRDLIAVDGNAIAVLNNSTESYYSISLDGGQTWFNTDFGSYGNICKIKDNKFYRSSGDGLKRYTLPDLELDFYDTVDCNYYYSNYEPIGENICVLDVKENSNDYYFTEDGGDSFEGYFSQPTPNSYSGFLSRMYELDNDELIVFFRRNYSSMYFSYGSLDGMTVNESDEVPEFEITLSNHPNPFNPSGAGRGPSTEIRFTAKNAEDAKIEIFNIKGQKIKSFPPSSCDPEPVEGRGGNTSYSVTWNGTDQNNHPVASGIYYYTLKLDGKIVASRKMVLLK